MSLDELDAYYYAAFFNRFFLINQKQSSIVSFFKIHLVKFPFYSKICYVSYNFMLHQICFLVLFVCFFLIKSKHCFID